jgi:hypothetical protein
MVLSEDGEKDNDNVPDAAGAQRDWLGLLVWIGGVGFLAILALWDMVASLFRR